MSPRPAPPWRRALASRPWVVAVVVVAVAGLAGLWLGTRHRGADTRDGEAETETPPSLSTGAATTPGELYFPSLDGRLYVERRELPVAEPALRAKLLVAALLAGPSPDKAASLRPPLPAGSRIEQVYLLGTTAVLDLRSPEPNPAAGDAAGEAGSARRIRPLSMGSDQELLALYSLVDTVAFGVEGVETVEILWDGRQPETFAGHVDTTRPLRPNRSLIASP